MVKKPSLEHVVDEPGAEERFLHGVRKVVKTPPKPFTPAAKDKAKGKNRANDQRSSES